VQIIEVTDFGVRSAVLRLRRSGTPMQFVVYPMLHAAEPAFFEAVTSRLATADVIVAEGVGRGSRPSPLVAALTLTYKVLRFNRRMHLVVQDIDPTAFGVPVVRPDVDAEEFRTWWRRIRWRDRLILWCVLPVVVALRLFGGTRAIWSKAMEVNDLPSAEDEELADVMPELDDAIMGERDRRLLAALGELHEQRGSEAIEVAVVYGAGHVPPIVHSLLARYGYRARGAEWITVVGFDGSTVGPAPEPARAEQQRAEPPTRRRSAPVPRRPAEPTAGRQAPATPPVTLESVEANVHRLRGLETGDPERRDGELSSALMRQAGLLLEAGRHEEAVAAADEAVDLAESLREIHEAGHNDTYGLVLAMLARCLKASGRIEQAAALSAEAVEVLGATQSPDPDRRAELRTPSLATHAELLVLRGDHRAATVAAQETIELCREASPQADVSVALAWIKALSALRSSQLDLGDAEAALDSGRRAVSVARRLVGRDPTRRRALWSALLQLAWTQWRLEADDGGLRSAEEAEAIARDLGDDRLLARSIQYTYRCYDESGQTRRALALTEEAVRICTDRADLDADGLGSLSTALFHHAEMLDAAGQPDEACDARDRAATLSDISISDG
jgi:tetratricopeptide (TPR) repeat protein